MVHESTVISIDDKNFTETIRSGITLVDFWAEWCMPCRMQTPILERLARRVNPEVKIRKFNVDKNPVIAAYYQITGIPSIFIFKDGEVVKQFIGVQNEEILMSAIGEISGNEGV
jgi:thioredoxin 1